MVCSTVPGASVTAVAPLFVARPATVSIAHLWRAGATGEPLYWAMASSQPYHHNPGIYVAKSQVAADFLKENISPFPSLTRYRGRSQFTAQEKARNAEIAQLQAEEARILAVLEAAKPKGAELLPTGLAASLQRSGINRGMAMRHSFLHPSGFVDRLEHRLRRDRAALEAYQAEQERSIATEAEAEAARISAMPEGREKARALATMRRARQHRSDDLRREVASKQKELEVMAERLPRELSTECQLDMNTFSKGVCGGGVCGVHACVRVRVCVHACTRACTQM